MTIREVQIQGISIARLEPLLTQERINQLAAVAEAARQALGTRRIININSTAAGGGVAEMMQVLLAYAKGVHIDVRWLVIQGTPEFFAITKRLHNWLHGSLGDGGGLSAPERAVYEQVLRDNAKQLLKLVRPGDIVILHDPQTAGLLHQIKEAGATVMWRCHIGSNLPNSIAEAGWEFLRPYLAEADAYIFTRVQYAPSWIDSQRTHVIQPSIDPFSPKNVALSALECEAVLGSASILNTGRTLTPSYTRSDGTQGTITRQAMVHRLGPAPSVDAPTVVQVSRWDRLKDMQGVMEGFTRYVLRSHGAHLMLVGPQVDGVTDDPEGAMVLAECVEYWEQLPLEERGRIHLVTLPMEDRDENAIMVNAIQRNATVIVQKSLAEGFGLTVTEAMWKARPVVASSVGGIPEQIVDGEHGLLLENPKDLRQLGSAINRLLSDDGLRERLGQNARARVINEFMADRHLEHYARLINEL